MSTQISLNELEALIRNRLEVFYNRRIDRLTRLKLDDLLAKNLYLFRAKGIHSASELIEELMRSNLTKSDETIFGKIFFEAIARTVAVGEEANQQGMDIVIETDKDYIVIEVKSASNWQNARMSRGIKADFNKAYELFISRGIQKQFVGILGQSTGQVNSEPDVDGNKIYLVRSGQGFWQEITGDPDFYLKLVRLMKDYPLRFRPDYQEVWAATLNRLTKVFADSYLFEDGNINWEKLIQAKHSFTPNSSSTKRTRAVQLNLDDLT
jgi:hypothetical protein